MRKRIYYSREKISPFFIGPSCILVIIATVAFIFFTLPEPENITLLTKLMIIIPASIWASVYCVRIYKYARRRREFIAHRNLLLNFGTKYAGRIVNTHREVRYSTDSDGRQSPDYTFTAKISFDKNGDEIKFWTEPLCFSANELVCKDVDVYVLDDDCLAYNFRDNPKVKINTLKAMKEYHLTKEQVIGIVAVILFPIVFIASIFGVVAVMNSVWK